MNSLNPEQIVSSLQLLGEILALERLGPFRIAVCGGAGLIACALVSRQTTRDVEYEQVAARL
jgi:hypothetical protein